MAPIRNASVIYAAEPTGFPIPGQHVVYRDNDTIDLETAPLNGGTLIKILYLSVDPYFRSKMRDPEVPGYLPAFEKGQIMEAYGIGKVLRSENPDYKPGQIVIPTFPYFPFQEYAIIPKDGAQMRIIDNTVGIPLQNYLSVAGMPSLTAWIGYKVYAKAKKGETIYVTIGAGAVGSIVCQLAKADGLKVIASAGTAEKIRYLKEDLGVDVAFNYHEQDVGTVLKEHGPIDIHWEMIGGKSLELALEHTNTNGRIIIAGVSGETNTADLHGIKNTQQILFKSLSITGLIYFRVQAVLGDLDFNAIAPGLVKEGKLQMREDVVVGLENLPQAIYDVQKGSNPGKTILQVAKE